MLNYLAFMPYMYLRQTYADDLAQDGSNYRVLKIQKLQSFTKPSSCKDVCFLIDYVDYLSKYYGDSGESVIGLPKI